MVAGRVILITGAGGEIGAALSAALPQSGDLVFLAGRSWDKMSDLARKMAREGVDYRPIALDLASLKSIASLAERIKGQTSRLDLLMLNAGIMATSRSMTEDGFESQIGVCHLGHFALTAHLLPLMKQTPKARVVTTTSSAAWFGRINFDDLQAKRKYDRYEVYCQAKLANALFAFELNRRFTSGGVDASANTAHPGLVYGNLQEVALKTAGWLERLMYPTVVKYVLSQSAERGIEPLLLAAGPNGEGGEMYGPKWFIKGPGRKVKAPKASRDEATAKRLWEVSEELIKTRFDF